jgi:hypothetical protein
MRLFNPKIWQLDFVAGLLMMAGCGTGSPSRPASHFHDVFSPDVRSLAREYRELRKQSGHYRGGEWNDDVDRYGGKLHRVMGELGKRLEGLPMKRADILALMGEPDATQTQGEADQLVYFWRGWHDYLYFLCEGESVKGIAWYFAYE